MSRLQQLIDAIPDEPGSPGAGKSDIHHVIALANQVVRRDAIIRAYHEALKAYGGHEDGCAGSAGVMDTRCTCGLSALLTRFEKEFGDGK